MGTVLLAGCSHEGYLLRQARISRRQSSNNIAKDIKTDIKTDIKNRY